MTQDTTDPRFQWFRHFFDYEVVPGLPSQTFDQGTYVILISELELHLDRWQWDDHENPFEFMEPLDRELLRVFYQMTTLRLRSNLTKFLDYHFDQWNDDPSDWLDFIEWTFQQVRPLLPDPETPAGYIIDWIDRKREQVRQPKQVPERIKWNASPSLFGFIFGELVSKGYITPPTTNSRPSYERLGKLLYRYFDIDTTEANIIKELKPENPETGYRPNTLSDQKRENFLIPYLHEVK
jgi:hypothetical protein